MGITIAVDADHRVAAARKSPTVSSRAATHIYKFAEMRQGSATADERCLLRRASLANTDVEELKPPTRVGIRLCSHKLRSGSGPKLGQIFFSSWINQSNVAECVCAPDSS